jgi:peptidoglycan/LPS O-acetylase OafA/YrhL
VPALTGIRAVACLWVFAAHAAPGYTPPLPARVMDLLAPGWLGVDIFFTLSGFILVTVYARLRLRGARSFYVRRLLRVYPLNIFLMAYIAANAAAHGRIGPGWFDLHNFVPYLLMLETLWPRTVGVGWLPTNWSVGVELICYAVFPLAIILLRRAPTVLLWPALLAVAAGQAASLHHFGAAIDGAAGVARGLTGFFTGAVAATLVARRPVGARPAAAVECLATALIPVLLLAQLLWLVPTCAAVLIAALARQAGPVSRILSTRVAVWLGDISYSIYLVHGLILGDWSGIWLRDARAALPEPLGSLVWLCLILGVTLAVAALTYRFVERPARTLFRRRTE